MKLHTNRYGQTIVLDRIAWIGEIIPAYRVKMTDSFTYTEPYRFLVQFDGGSTLTVKNNIEAEIMTDREELVELLKGM